MYAVLHSPRNRPCCTTPGTSSKASERASGVEMRPKEASRIRCPPSVTKGSPAASSRSLRPPSAPKVTNISARTRCVAPKAELVDFDRQRKPAECRHLLRDIGNHHHPIGSGGHNLLPQQCAAAALDEIELGVELIRAVDGQVEPVDGVEVGERNVEAARLGGGHLGSRNAKAGQPIGHPRTEQIDKMPRRGASAEADAHAAPDLAEGPSPRLPAFPLPHMSSPPSPQCGGKSPAGGSAYTRLHTLVNGKCRIMATQCRPAVPAVAESSASALHRLWQTRYGAPFRHRGEGSDRFSEAMFDP